MVWPFSSSSSSSPPQDTSRAAAIRSGAAVPSRAERQACWDARDRFFGCLDAHGIVDADADAKAAAAHCAAEAAALDRACAAQWVAHFKKFRVAQVQKEKRLAALRAQGAIEMDVQSHPGDTVARR